MSNRTYFNQAITSLNANGQAEISKTYSNSFLKVNGDSKYAVAVDKFRVELSGVPLLIWNPARFYYTIELVQGGVSSGVFDVGAYFYSVWTGSGMAATDPKFYYVYAYDHIINILNTAMAACYTAFAAAPGLIIPGGDVAPFFYVSPNQLLNLYVSHTFIEGAANQYQIFVNNNLSYELLQGMPKLGINPDVLTSLPTYRDVRMLSFNNTVNAETYGGQVYYRQTTNSGVDSLIKWNVCMGVVITSNMETKQESFPEGLYTFPTTGTINQTLNATLNGQNILMNFDILYTDNCRPLFLNYVSSDFKKFVNMTQSRDISNIGLKFWWYDRFNRLYSLTVYKMDGDSIRLCFLENAFD